MFILYLRETWVALPPKHYKTFVRSLVYEGMDFVQNGSAKGTPFWKPFSNELQYNDKSDQHYGSSTCLVTLMNVKALVSQNHFQSLNRRPKQIRVGTYGDGMIRKKG